jgi:hypothetical protein
MRSRPLSIALLVLASAIILPVSASAAAALGTGAAKAHAARALAEKYGASWSQAGRSTKSLTVKRRQSSSRVRFSYVLATTVEKEGTCPSPEASAAECTPAEAQQATYTGVVIVWRPPASPRHVRARVVQKSSEVGPCAVAC